MHLAIRLSSCPFTSSSRKALKYTINSYLFFILLSLSSLCMSASRSCRTTSWQRLVWAYLIWAMLKSRTISSSPYPEILPKSSLVISPNMRVTRVLFILLEFMKAFQSFSSQMRVSESCPSKLESTIDLMVVTKCFWKLWKLDRFFSFFFLG